jgi:ATP-dependent Lon protease
MPLWIKRPKTIRALSEAFSSGRQIVLVAQRNANIEEPDGNDVYEIGVMGRVIDVGPPSGNVIAHNPSLDGSTQVLVQTEGRVSVQRFTGQAGSYQAQVKHMEEGDLAEAPDLIVAAAVRFDSYSAAHNITVRPTWPPLVNSMILGASPI